MNTPVIELSGVGKVFESGSGRTTALDGIDLAVERGEIFAVIGYSGAGKSTLVRLINGLDRPTSGSVVVNGTDITTLRGKALRAVRADIGMVFQQFNLFSSRTVFGNVAYPLQLAGWSKERQKARVAELLSFVGLLDKAWAHPEALSGGQKQRIGIARALATSPQILLADECTSALDPETTRDVLDLLRRVNEELGVTIVAITHEMEVVRAVADRVAVLDDGRLAEVGPVRTLLTEPAAEVTRRFVSATLEQRPSTERLARLREEYAGELVTVSAGDRRGLGRVLSHAARTHGIDFEIVHGGITELKGESLGTFTIALTGDRDGIHRTVEALGARPAAELETVGASA